MTHRPTSTYTPQYNLVERANRTLKTMTRQYVGKRHRQWDNHLPALQLAYNSAQQSFTGYTPAYLNCGREIRSAHAPLGLDPDASFVPLSRARHLKEAYDLVKVHLACAF